MLKPAASCGQRLADDVKHGIPDVAIVGASFTAGQGSGGPSTSWAVQLAHLLHWNVDVYGVAGAGYVHRGTDHLGPMSAELGRLDLPEIDPSLVIVQAGHNDMRVPVQTEEQRVKQTIALIRTQAPHARIVLLTVYTTHTPSPAAYRTNAAIVAAGLAADPDAIIIDPLLAHWSYQRAADGLHPTETGSTWIAHKVATDLHADNVLVAPAPPARTPTAHTTAARAAVICDYGVQYPAGKRSRIKVPPPGPHSARIDPPWLSATWRTMASPSPEPGTPRAEGAR